MKKNASKVTPQPKKRLKKFLTRFRLPNKKGEYGWYIKAYDFEEAELICERISHQLEGKLAGKPCPVNDEYVVISKKDVDRINRYMIDTSKLVSDKTRASAKWQQNVSRILNSLNV